MPSKAVARSARRKFACRGGLDRIRLLPGTGTAKSRPCSGACPGGKSPQVRLIRYRSRRSCLPLDFRYPP